MPNKIQTLDDLQPKVSLSFGKLLTHTREKAGTRQLLDNGKNGFRTVRTVTEQTVTEQPYIIHNSYDPAELAPYGLLVTELNDGWLIAWYPGDRPDVYPGDDDPEIAYVFDKSCVLIGYAPSPDGPFVFCTKDARKRAIRSVIDYDSPVIRDYALYRDPDGLFWTDLPELGGIQICSAEDLAKTKASMALQDCFYARGRFYDGNPYAGGTMVKNTNDIPLTTMRSVA